LNKIIIFNPNPFYKYVGLYHSYEEKFCYFCEHKEEKSIEYRYDTVVLMNSDIRKRKNYFYTFRVCQQCYEKNHEEWMNGDNLPKKYLDNEVIIFRKDSSLIPASNLS